MKTNPIVSYCHPIDHSPLEKREDGNLYDRSGKLVFKGMDGSYDFNLGPVEEREFHDSLYADGGWCASDEPLDHANYAELWDQDSGCDVYLNSLGDVKGKTILLIGNGTSVKEFLFVKRGAHVVFTDLSLEGVLYAKRRYSNSSLGRDGSGSCEFHAVDASQLPFETNTFDIICADAVIHHVEDLQRLMEGFHRCLKPGGICRFRDTGYSPAWQGAKKTVLKPLQRYIHRKHPISPEDQIATERGGYSREEFESVRSKLGFRGLFYKRVALFDYLLWRTRCKFNMRWILTFRPLIRGIDRVLLSTPIMEAQGVTVVCGFDK